MESVKQNTASDKTDEQKAVAILSAIVEQANAGGKFTRLSDISLALGSLQVLKELADKDAEKYKQKPDIEHPAK